MQLHCVKAGDTLNCRQNFREVLIIDKGTKWGHLPLFEGTRLPLSYGALINGFQI